jgi:hypothetical protein
MQANERDAGAAPATSANAVIALYCEDPGAKLRIQHFLQRHVNFVEATSPQSLIGLAQEASCTVVGVRRNSGVVPNDYLVVLRRLRPFHPLVIVTVDDRTAHCLTRAAGDEVVRLRDLERELGPAISRACLNDFLERLASNVEVVKALPATLRAALALVYRARPPIRSVKELAARICCQPRTLEHHWRSSVARRGLRLHDLLGWVLLLHATTERLKTVKWAAVAAQLGVSSQTLARLGKTLADLSLRELAVLGHRGTLPLFRQRVLATFAEQETRRRRA